LQQQQPTKNGVNEANWTLRNYCIVEIAATKREKEKDQTLPPD
jgi:hypothetical protein